MKELLINRYGKTFFAHLYLSEAAEKLAFVQHGYSGSVDEVHIQAIIKTYLNNGYNVVAFDCTHSFNEADGELEDATLAFHCHDLEDGIAWASAQTWYREPFALAGHSLGGCSVVLYAEAHPDKILNLFAAAALLNGPLREEAYNKYAPSELAHLRAEGRVPKSSIRHGKTYQGWRSLRTFESFFAADALASASALTMPLLQLSGSKDTSCPPEHQLLLHEAASGQKQIKFVEGADHCYSPHLQEVVSHLSLWLSNV